MYRYKNSNFPSIKDLVDLCKEIKKQISDEYRAFIDDDVPGIQLTVGADGKGGWSYQTGDNSYTGGAYSYPHWAVVGVYRSSNCHELAKDILLQLYDLYEQSQP